MVSAVSFHTMTSALSVAMMSSLFTVTSSSLSAARTTAMILLTHSAFKFTVSFVAVSVVSFLHSMMFPATLSAARSTTMVLFLVGDDVSFSFRDVCPSFHDDDDDLHASDVSSNVVSSVSFGAFSNVSSCGSSPYCSFCLFGELFHDDQ